jgi:hypothetical protein
MTNESPLRTGRAFGSDVSLPEASMIDAGAIAEISSNWATAGSR